MSTYERPVRVLMRQMIDEMGLDSSPEQAFSADEALDWFKARYPLLKESTIRAHLVRHSINNKNRLHHSSLRPDGSDDLFFQIDGSRFRRYNKTTDPAPIRRGTEVAGPAPFQTEGTDSPDVPSSAFAYEDHLRDFLSRNLEILEPGLHLYTEGDITGVEFPVGGRFIDILGVDSSGGYVVIELKVSKGHEKAIGQLLRYMGWIEQNHAEPGQRVRGIIVAKEVSDDLKLAVIFSKDIRLFEYDLAVSVRPVMQS